MAGALPLCIRTKCACESGPMVNVYPDQKVNVYPDQKVNVYPDQKGHVYSDQKVHVCSDKNVPVYSDQRSIRLPSPAQRAGFRVGIIAQRANGPAICPMMQMSGPLALRDSIRCALTFNQRIHTDLPREKRIKSNQHPRLILSVKELAINQRHRLIIFTRENHDADCHDTLDETALVLATFCFQGTGTLALSLGSSTKSKSIHRA